MIPRRNGGEEASLSCGGPEGGWGGEAARRILTRTQDDKKKPAEVPLPNAQNAIMFCSDVAQSSLKSPRCASFFSR